MSGGGSRPGTRGLVNWRAVAAGAALALAVAVPTIVVASLVGTDPDSALVFVPYLVYLAGQAAGGWLAARREPDAPLSNGALSALVAYAILIVVASLIRIVRGDSLNLVALVVNTFLATSAGIFGGLVAGWTLLPDADASGNKPPGRRPA